MDSILVNICDVSPWPWPCLYAKFCGLGLGTGLGLRGLALAKNSRPKSWQTTKFTVNFHRPEHCDWSELYFKIHVPYLLTVGNCGLVRVLEQKQDFVTFYRNLCIIGWPWPWDCGLGFGLDSVWPWPCPWSVGLGLGVECSGPVNITEYMIRLQSSMTSRSVT